MTRKFPICPDRIRSIPEQFSWVDHRLVRNHHIDLLTHEAAVLYLFLVTVADSQGVSHYSDASLEKRLAMDALSLAAARTCLAQAGLVAYRKPLYQVLAVDGGAMPSQRRRMTGEPLAIAEIFKGLIGGVR